MLAAVLEQRGYKVFTFENGQAVKEALKNWQRRGESVDLLVTDIHMPVVNGLQVLAWVHQHNPWLRCIAITAFGDPTLHERAHALGADRVIDKPFCISGFCSQIHQLISPRTGP